MNRQSARARPASGGLAAGIALKAAVGAARPVEIIDACGSSVAIKRWPKEHQSSQLRRHFPHFNTPINWQSVHGSRLSTICCGIADAVAAQCETSYAVTSFAATFVAGWAV